MAKRDPFITKKNKEIKALLNCKKAVNKEISAIKALHTSLGSKTQKEAEAYIESMPLNTITDFSNLENGKTDYRLHKLHERTKLRKRFEQKEEDLEDIESSIRTAKMDVLLAKIKNTLS